MIWASEPDRYRGRAGTSGSKCCAVNGMIWAASTPWQSVVLHGADLDGIMAASDGAQPPLRSTDGTPQWILELYLRSNSARNMYDSAGAAFLLAAAAPSF